MHTNHLGNSYDQPCQCPDDPCIVIPSKDSEEDDESLQDHRFHRIEETRTGEGLFNGEAITGQEDDFGFSKFCNAICRRERGNDT